MTVGALGVSTLLRCTRPDSLDWGAEVSANVRDVQTQYETGEVIRFVAKHPH